MKYGCHIRVFRDFYSHHGIYVGEDMVIHYKPYGIVLSSLSEFAGNDTVIEVYHEGQDFAETVSRAYSRLGENMYNLVFNNCESFANWCATGCSRSKQVEGVFTFIERILS